MANTLRFKRGSASGIPTAAAGEPLFTTDTFDLYIGNGTSNTRFQKYIASGTTSQYLRGDGSLATFPSLTGYVPYTGATANVDLGVYTILAQNATIASSGSGDTATITHSSGSGIALNITKGGAGEGLYINKTSGSGNAATIIGTLNATTLVKSGGTSSQYLMADGSTSTLTNPITGSLTTNYLPKATGATTLGNSLVYDNGTNVGINTNTPAARFSIVSNTSQASNDIITQINYGAIGATPNTKRAIYIDAITASANDIANSIRHFETGNVSLTANAGRYVYGSYYGLKFGTLSTTGVSGIPTSHYHIFLDNMSGGASDESMYGIYIGTIASGTSYGIHSNVASGTGRWNLYMNGTANNYMAGSLGIGSTSGLTDVNLKIGKVIGGSVFPISVYASGTVSSAATTGAVYFQTDAVTENAVFTLPNLYHFRANQSTFGASSTVTNQYGFFADNSLSGATNDFGFYGNLASATGRWNLYMNGTALNYLNGSLLIGSTTDTGEKLQVTGTMKVTGASYFSDVVGIGGSSNAFYPLIIYRATAGVGLQVFNSTTYSQIRLQSSGTNQNSYLTFNGTGTGRAIIQVNDTDRLTIDASGNLGLGVTPSAWNSGYKAFQVLNLSLFGTSSLDLNLGSNVFGDSSGNYKYIGNGFASLYNQYLGKHYWNIAANNTSGAGAALTFTQAMTLTAAGRLLLNQTSDTGEQLQVTGTAKITGQVTFNGNIVQTGSSARTVYNNASASGGLSNDLASAYILLYGSTHATKPNQTEIEGSGGIKLLSALTGTSATFTGNLTVDTNTLFVDATNNRVGIGTTSLSYSLHVAGTGYFTDNVRFTNTKGLLFENSGASAVGNIYMGNSATNNLVITNGTNTITLVTLGTSISSNLLVGASTIGTSATNTIAVVNGTAPSSSATDIFHLYSADVTAGNAAPHFRTENGAVIKLYQETTAVGNAIIGAGGGSAVLDDDTFDGYTLRQIVRALRNQGILQ